jgi:hypothetical protein
MEAKAMAIGFTQKVAISKNNVGQPCLVRFGCKEYSDTYPAVIAYKLGTKQDPVALIAFAGPGGLILKALEQPGLEEMVLEADVIETKGELPVLCLQEITARQPEYFEGMSLASQLQAHAQTYASNGVVLGSYLRN